MAQLCRVLQHKLGQN